MIDNINEIKEAIDKMPFKASIEEIVIKSHANSILIKINQWLTSDDIDLLEKLPGVKMVNYNEAIKPYSEAMIIFTKTTNETEEIFSEMYTEMKQLFKKYKLKLGYGTDIR